MNTQFVKNISISNYSVYSNNSNSANFVSTYFCQTVQIQTIQFSISMQLVLFNPEIGYYEVRPFWARVDLGAMAMKGCSAFPIAPASLEPYLLQSCSWYILQPQSTVHLSIYLSIYVCVYLRVWVYIIISDTILLAICVKRWRYELSVWIKKKKSEHLINYITGFDISYSERVIRLHPTFLTFFISTFFLLIQLTIHSPFWNL